MTLERAFKDEQCYSSKANAARRGSEFKKVDEE